MASSTHNNDCTLSHASFVSYFLPTSTSENETTTTHRRTSHTTTTQSPYQDNTYDSPSEDEESQVGFWGEYTPLTSKTPTSPSKFKATKESSSWLRASPITPFYSSKSSKSSFYTFCCTWCLFSISVLMVLGTLFSVDAGLSTYDLDLGVARRVFTGIAEPVIEIPLCLSTPNRSVPGPQRWLRMSNSTDCHAETLKMRVSETEAWKLLPTDEVLMGEDMSGKVKAMMGKWIKQAKEQEEKREEEEREQEMEKREAVIRDVMRKVQSEMERDVQRKIEMLEGSNASSPTVSDGAVSHHNASTD